MENDRMVNSAATSVYTPDITNGNGDTILPTVPIQGYEGFIRPADDARAKALGDACAREIAGKILADFEKTEAYCRRNGGKPDQMVHVSTFVILDGMVYMTYYANPGTDQGSNSFFPKDALCPAFQQLAVLRMHIIKSR